MSAPTTDYYLLGGHFDLSSQIKQEAPPYLPDPLLPPYNLKPMAHERRPSAFDTGTEHTFGAGPDDTSVREFDLAESIWSRDSDLTLDDLALESDSASRHSRSSTSSRWSAAPLTPTSPHQQLPPTRESAPPTGPVPILVDPTAAPPATESEPELPDSPAPAYSRDPLEFDPALLASLDSQLRDRPFEAFEDTFWACFTDPPPVHQSPYTSRALNSSLSQLYPPTPQASFTAHTSYSESSMATLVTSLPPLPPPPPPPPAYPTSKPLPNLPPPSPRSSAGHSQPPRTPVVMSFESFVTLEDPPYPASPPAETVQFFPLRAPVRPRSKSVGGPKTVRRLTGAIARLRGRE